MVKFAICHEGHTNTNLKTILFDFKLHSISDFYISCNPVKKIGNIESLLLSTIPKEQKECIDAFLECSEFKAKGNDKALLGQIYKLAYPNTPYTFQHKYFVS